MMNVVVFFVPGRMREAQRLSMGQGLPEDTSISAAAELRVAGSVQGKFRSPYKPFPALGQAWNHPSIQESLVVAPSDDITPEPSPLVFFTPKLGPAQLWTMFSRSQPQDGSFAPPVIDVAVGSTPRNLYRKDYTFWMPMGPPPTDQNLAAVEPPESFGTIPRSGFRNPFMPWPQLRLLLGSPAYDDSLVVAPQDADLGTVVRNLFRRPYRPGEALRRGWNHPAFDDSIAAPPPAGQEYGSIPINLFRNRYAAWPALRGLLGTGAFDETIPLPIIVIPPIPILGAPQRWLRLVANNALVVPGQSMSITVTGVFGISTDYVVARSASWLTDIQITNKTSTSFLATFNVPAPDAGGVLDWMVFA